jgi:hypothetical protein
MYVIMDVAEYFPKKNIPNFKPVYDNFKNIYGSKTINNTNKKYIFLKTKDVTGDY